ncbi:MAG: ClbS/DfsB family four-helix bundle protein [Anaerolineales bacterium]|nr:ClbS/DfsB family four-helix bundle protein [Anaerolineales bacterium]
MKKAKLLQAMQSTRQELQALIADLTPEQMQTPDVHGGWSVKDILIHLTLWEAELIKLLFQAEQGRQPASMHFSTQSEDQINAAWQQAHRERDLEQVLQDFNSIRPQTIRRVERLEPQVIEQTGYYPWLKDANLAARIAADTCEHDEEHAATIRAWRQQKGI